MTRPGRFDFPLVLTIVQPAPDIASAPVMSNAEMETIDVPDTVRREIKNGNFVRAVHLAVENNLPSDRIRELQCAAVRQFIEMWHNFKGAEVLIAKYDLGADEVRTIVRNVLNGPRANEVRNYFDPKNGNIVAMTLVQRILRDPVLRKYV